MKHYLQKMVYIILSFESPGNNLTLLYLKNTVNYVEFSKLCLIAANKQKKNITNLS